MVHSRILHAEFTIAKCISICVQYRRPIGAALPGTAQPGCSAGNLRRISVATKWRLRLARALMFRDGLLNPRPWALPFTRQIPRRGDLDFRQRRHGHGQIRGRYRHRQSRADLRGAALLGRRGRDRRHLDGGAGFRPSGGRGTSLRPRQARELVGAGRYRDALRAGGRDSGRIIQPPARGCAAADAVGDPVHRTARRYRREFLARPRAAPRRARHQEPGTGRRRAAFCAPTCLVRSPSSSDLRFPDGAMPGAMPPPRSAWRS